MLDNLHSLKLFLRDHRNSSLPLLYGQKDEFTVMITWNSQSTTWILSNRLLITFFTLFMFPSDLYGNNFTFCSPSVIIPNLVLSLLCVAFYFTIELTEVVPEIAGSVINSIEGDDFHLSFHHMDEWHEQEPLQSVQVQVAWRPVWGHEADHVVVEERLEQPLQDHRIRNVQHLELIKA